MNIIMNKEKATKNTIRFTEVLGNEHDSPKIGTLYVPKVTLGAVGWKEGKQLVIEINVK